MKTITLIGMMGSGKSTIGKLLAQNLNCAFIDIDSLIEKNENSKISEIFNKKGEAFFRKIEKETIKNNITCENFVIATGGGAFEDKDTRELLLKISTVIYLKTSPKIILERLENDTSRPLLCGNMSVEKFSEIIEIRKQNYESAPITITTDNKSPDQIISEITGVLK